MELNVLQGRMESLLNEALEKMPDLAWTVVLALPISETQVNTWSSSTLSPAFLVEVLEKSTPKSLDKVGLVS